MKETVRLSVIQFAPEWLKPKENALRMKEFAEIEAKKGAELIVFPELSNVGYITPFTVGGSIHISNGTSYIEFHKKYIKVSEPVPGPTTDLLAQVAHWSNAYIVVGLSETHPILPAHLYNSAVLIGPQGIIGVHRKVHLTTTEKHFFVAGNAAEVYRTDLGNISMTVCYDGRFPEFVRVFALKGSEIHCAIWNTPDTGYDPDSIKYRAYVRAAENNFYFISCNRAGMEGSASYLGHSAVAGPGGDIIVYSDSKEEEVLCAVLSNEVLLDVRTKRDDLRSRRPEMYSIIAEPLSSYCDPLSARARDKGE